MAPPSNFSLLLLRKMIIVNKKVISEIGVDESLAPLRNANAKILDACGKLLYAILGPPSLLLARSRTPHSGASIAGPPSFTSPCLWVIFILGF